MADVWRFFSHEDDYADLAQDELCARLGRALSIRTVGGPTREETDWAAFDELEDLFRDSYPYVFESALVERIDHSLLLTLEGTNEDLDPVMLMGHMDVVCVVEGTESDWTHDAFSGHVDGECVWGRGALDMKDQLVGELEDLLGATVRNVDLKSLDLVNDTTIVEVHYRLHHRSRKAKPSARLEADNAQQIPQQLQDATPQGPHLIQDAPRQDPVQVHPTAQQVWPEPSSHDSAASAATAPPRYDWITGNRSQHVSQQRDQSATPPPPVVHPHYN